MAQPHLWKKLEKWLPQIRLGKVSIVKIKKYIKKVA